VELAYRRCRKITSIGDDASKELDKVEDDIKEVLGVENFKWMLPDDLTEY
jgi:hypothetical protein